nr:replication protein A 70 kDa DNA-binding subunit-like [Ipomoea batatas]
MLLRLALFTPVEQYECGWCEVMKYLHYVDKLLVRAKNVSFTMRRRLSMFLLNWSLLIGKAMVFKVNIKKDYKQNYGSAFGVMKILNDENIVAAYCSSFGVDQEKDLISKMLEDYGNEYSEDDESGVMKLTAQTILSSQDSKK